jgi:hypothetical protein
LPLSTTVGRVAIDKADRRSQLLIEGRRGAFAGRYFSLRSTATRKKAE